MRAEPMPPGQSFKEIAMRAWNSTRLAAFVLVAVAVVVGGHLRLHRLARSDMSGDEGASWAAASAPTAWEVANTERRLDPGKLALYDLILHEWIGTFGDRLFVMHALSAGLGTFAIVLVFIAVREVCGSLAGDSATALGEMAGAFAALLYATNLAMVLSDRAVRMYAFVMCAELLQITFLVRAQHSDEAAWREATSLAEQSIGPRDRIAVYPPYCVQRGALLHAACTP
jgi:hypothetical protein